MPKKKPKKETSQRIRQKDMFCPSVKLAQFLCETLPNKKSFVPAKKGINMANFIINLLFGVAKNALAENEWCYPIGLAQDNEKTMRNFTVMDPKHPDCGKQFALATIGFHALQGYANMTWKYSFPEGGGAKIEDSYISRPYMIPSITAKEVGGNAKDFGINPMWPHVMKSDIPLSFNEALSVCKAADSLYDNNTVYFFNAFGIKMKKYPPQPDLTKPNDFVNTIYAWAKEYSNEMLIVEANQQGGVK